MWAREETIRRIRRIRPNRRSPDVNELAQSTPSCAAEVRLLVCAGFGAGAADDHDARAQRAALPNVAPPAKWNRAIARLGRRHVLSEERQRGRRVEPHLVGESLAAKSHQVGNADDR